jgi:uncharacterized membrane protein YkvA (DUF1232 family)
MQKLGFALMAATVRFLSNPGLSIEISVCKAALPKSIRSDEARPKALQGAYPNPSMSDSVAVEAEWFSMTVAVGFGELFDRVEKHIGEWPTKILVFAAWFAAMAFFINSTFDYIVKPILKIGPDVYTALGFIDILRVVFTVLIGVAMGSWVLDAYRMKLLRTEYEAAAGKAHGLVDEMRAFRSSATVETREVIDDATDLVAAASTAVEHARSVHVASFLIAEALYKVAANKTVMSDEAIGSLKSLMDDLRVLITDNEVQRSLLIEVNSSRTGDDPAPNPPC